MSFTVHTTRFFYVFFTAMLLTGLYGCHWAGNQPEIKTTTQHPQDTAFEVPGIYMGTLPCADCSGIEYTLTMNPDSTFVLKSTYLGKPADRNVFIEAGSWTLIAPRMLQLELPQKIVFLKSKGKNLLWLDNQGTEIKSAQNYQLSRIGDFE